MRNSLDIKIRRDKWMGIGYPLSMEERLFGIRKEIESGKKHKGENLILVKAAYNEIRDRMGKNKRELKCGSRCINDINKQLSKWFGLVDKRSESQKRECVLFLKAENKGLDLDDIVSGSGSEGELVPVDDRRSMLESMDFGDLVEKVKDLPKESQDLLREKRGKYPLNKAEDIINEILKY